MRVFRVSVLVVLLFSIVLPAAAQRTETFELELRPGVRSWIAVDIYESSTSRGVNRGLNILMVHGFAQTAATFGPLAQALLDDLAGARIQRVVVPDLPAHGDSTGLVGTDFGFLTLNDHVTAIEGVLHELAASGIRIDAVIGHSMGALIVQLAQDRLIRNGSSLRDAHGIRSVVLIGSALPAAVPWQFVESGAAGAILSRYLLFGLHLEPRIFIPAPGWVVIFYSDRQGVIPPAAPTAAEASAYRYISRESGAVAFQLVGALGSRPAVAEGIFGPAQGTTAGVIALEQDTFSLFPGEQQNLYRHLTGDSRDKRFYEVTGAETVHNMHTFDPQALLRPIRLVVTAMGH